MALPSDISPAKKLDRKRANEWNGEFHGETGETPKWRLCFVRIERMETNGNVMFEKNARNATRNDYNNCNVGRNDTTIVVTTQLTTTTRRSSHN